MPSESIDVVLLYDAFHDLEDQQAVLGEIHRVLKQNGLLSFSDHHLKDGDILSMVTDRELFRLLRKGDRTYSFVKDKASLRRNAFSHSDFLAYWLRLQLKCKG